MPRHLRRYIRRRFDAAFATPLLRMPLLRAPRRRLRRCRHAASPLPTPLLIAAAFFDVCHATLPLFSDCAQDV